MSKSIKAVGRPYFYALALLFLNLLICSLFCLVRFDKAGAAGRVYLVLQCIGCSFLYILPALFFAWLSNFTGRFRIVFEIIGLLLAFPIMLVLLLDFGIVCRFGYHVNGMVINLLCTKGGFESMGLDLATIAPLALGILFFAVLHLCLWLVCLFPYRVLCGNFRICRSSTCGAMCTCLLRAFNFGCIACLRIRSFLCKCGCPFSI